MSLNDQDSLKPAVRRMSGRERLEAVMARRAKDRMPWTALVDDNSLSLSPEELRGNHGMDFYRHIGCDVFLLNGWGAPYQFKAPELRWGPEVKISHRQEGDMSISVKSTPKGDLTAANQKGHPVRYPVDSIEAVKIYREMWEAAEFVNHDDTETFKAIEKLLGDSGIMTRFWGPSAIPRLLEFDMGVENFYLLHNDHPEEVNALIETIHHKMLKAFEILARGPWDSVTLCENTSTYYISPDLYRQHNMPHQRDFVEIYHAAGKTAILHMCGHVHGLLEMIKETKCDGIHALTQAPVGDTPWEEALDVLGEELIIFGALDPTVMVSGPLEGIPANLDRVITPRLRKANFVPCLFADGLPVSLERFLAVRDWMARS